MASDSISSETKELELALRGMHATDLDPDFLDRLESAADGTLTELTEMEMRFESSLRAHAPSALDPDFMNRLESVVSDVQFPVDEKIVLFPRSAPPVKTKRTPRPMWAAAAAVALIGGISALMFPQGGKSSPAIANRGTPTPANPAQVSNFVPAGFNSEADTEDVGVSWHQTGQPHRILRLTYRDRVTLKNADGKTIEVEQPRVEYILVPEKMD
jgi:hypothetical protein